MSKEFLKLVEVEIEKRKFSSFKNPIWDVEDIEDVDSNKICYVVCFLEKLKKKGKKNFKYFIGYKNGEKVKALCIKFPQISEYLNSFEENK